VKKSLVLALVVSFVLSIAATAFAADLDVNGDFRVRALSVDDNVGVANAYKHSGFEFRARLNFNVAVDKDTTFYSRFTARNQFNSASGFGLGSDVRSNNEFDQFGLKTKADNWNLVIGRQAVNLGQGSIISTGNDAAGADTKFDGITASSKLGAFDVNVIAGKTTDTFATGSVEYYGLDAATKLDNKVTFGAAYASGKNEAVGSEAAKYLAFNTTFAAAPNLTFNAEYVKSNANTNNKGYFVAGTYSFDKDSITLQYNRVEGNAVDNVNSGIAAGPYSMKGQNITNDYKGFTFVYAHPVTKAVDFSLVYMDLQSLHLSGSDKEVGANVSWKF
jgi:hypothetical protein